MKQCSTATLMCSCSHSLHRIYHICAYIKNKTASNLLTDSKLEESQTVELLNTGEARHLGSCWKSHDTPCVKD
jgi:hypothetical protein